ncbi:MAG: hypothetical protein H6734_09645 [Alphaproteobacteria bacterium]|nr:hypothetical protein [Alphaproteobacteria bacterium]
MSTGVVQLFGESSVGDVFGLSATGRYVKVVCNGGYCESWDEVGLVQASMTAGIRDDDSLTVPFLETRNEDLDFDGRWLVLDRSGVLAMNARHDVWSLFDIPDGASPLHFDLPGRSPRALTGWVANGRIEGACVLDDAGAIHCAGSDPYWDAMPFGDDAYVFMDGSRRTVCAVRARDHRILCHDGSTYDFGRIRAFAAYGYAYYDEDGVYHSQSLDQIPSLCAITERNAIRCAGPRYLSDIQAQLEAVNAEHELPEWIPGRR